VGLAAAAVLLSAQTIGHQRVSADGVARAAATAFPVDHFACYPSQLTGGHKPKVSLKNQFGAASAVPVTLFKLCAPARKNGSPILDKKAHLTCYTLTSYHGPTTNRVVSVTNQFGTQTMTVVLNPPQSLCLPSSKAAPGVAPGPVPTTLDHYLCYAVRPNGAFAAKTVKIADQFGNSSDTVNAPRSLCLPTSKNGSTPDPLDRPSCLLPRQVNHQGPQRRREKPVRTSERRRRPARPPLRPLVEAGPELARNRPAEFDERRFGHARELPDQHPDHHRNN